MKQKIIIEAHIECEKCRAKAMKIAAPEDGVISVAFKGSNQMVITGDGVDAASLTKALRKKLGYADLVNVEEITQKKADDHQKKENQETKQEEEIQQQASSAPLTRPQTCSRCPHMELIYMHDLPSSSWCTIL